MNVTVNIKNEHEYEHMTVIVTIDTGMDIHHTIEKLVHFHCVFADLLYTSHDLINFNSTQAMSEPIAKSFLGTRGYLAPEMLQRRDYSYAADLWALGVIVFVLLCGCLPFDDDSSSIPSDELVRSKFVLRFPRWARNLSPSAKDLVAKLLDVNPRTRFTAKDASEHPWVQGNSAPQNSMLQSPGKIILTPGRGASHSNQKKAEATRSQMNQMIANRARANSLPRKAILLVRKKSI